MDRLRTWLYRGTLLVALAAVGWTLTRALRSEAADVPRPSEATASARPLVSAGDVHETRAPRGWVSGPGLVEPADREVKLGSEVPGLVSRVRVREGETVRAGTVLVELLSDAERADVEARRADLEATRARAQLSASQAARVSSLFGRGATTSEERDRVTFQAAADDAAVKQAEAQVLAARARLERLTIRAPAVGTVLRIHVRDGEYYNPAAAALLTMGDLSRIRVRADIDERQVGAVRVGQRAFVTAKAFGERRFQGTVVELAQRMGRKTVRSDEPTERVDTTIREAVVELDDGRELVQGLRVVAFINPDSQT